MLPSRELTPATPLTFPQCYNVPITLLQLLMVLRKFPANAWVGLSEWLPNRASTAHKFQIMPAICKADTERLAQYYKERGQADVAFWEGMGGEERCEGCPRNKYSSAVCQLCFAVTNREEAIASSSQHIPLKQDQMSTKRRETLGVKEGGDSWLPKL
jgi:hypothetical protein